MTIEEFDKFLEFLETKGYGNYKRTKIREFFLEYLLTEASGDAQSQAD